MPKIFHKVPLPKILLPEVTFELPIINDSGYGQVRHYEKYRFIYGMTREDLNAKRYSDSLVKVDLLTQSHIFYRPGVGCCPSEGLFIPRPQNVGNPLSERPEDDGVILTVVLDAKNIKTYLVVLNACDMTEMARVLIPVYIPYGFHGSFQAL